MAGVADSNVIDVVAEGADGQVLALMMEDRPWGSDERQVDQLKEKFNNYLLYITTGQYEEQIPGSEGRPVTIQLHCTAPPPEPFASLLDFTERQLATYGIDFELLVTITPTGSGYAPEGSVQTSGSSPQPDRPAN